MEQEEYQKKLENSIKKLTKQYAEIQKTKDEKQIQVIDRPYKDQPNWLPINKTITKRKCIKTSVTINGVEFEEKTFIITQENTVKSRLLKCMKKNKKQNEIKGKLNYRDKY